MALYAGDMLDNGALIAGASMFDDTPVFSSAAVINANNWAASTFQVQVEPAGAAVSLQAPVMGVSFNAVTKQLALDFRTLPPGVREIVLVANNNGTIAEQTVSIVVDGRPVFFNPASVSVQAGVLAPLTIEAQDPEGAVLTLSALTIPSGLVFTPNPVPVTTGNGLVFTGVLSGSLIGGVHTATFRAIAANGGGQTDFTLTITAATAANLPPVITSSNSLTVVQGQTATRNIIASDPNGDSVVLSLSSAHDWITLQGNQVVASPGFLIPAGQYQAVITGSDGQASVNQTLFITVQAAAVSGVVPIDTPKERTIYVQRDGSVLMSPFFQDPLAAMDYRIDYSRWLSPTDSIDSVVFEEDDDMQITAQSSDSMGGTVMLTAGEDRSQYIIIARATTAQGRVHIQRFFVHVIAWAV